jgi:hypothetical protein
VDTLAHLRGHDRRRSPISKGGETRRSPSGDAGRYLTAAEALAAARLKARQLADDRGMGRLVEHPGPGELVIFGGWLDIEELEPLVWIAAPKLA